MGSFISPNDLNNDPKRWLSIPHEMHDSLSSLMSKVFDLDWKMKLADNSVHCFACEGRSYIPCIADDKRAICDGFVGESMIDPRSMIHTREPEYGEFENEFAELEKSYAMRQSLLSSIQTGEPSVIDVTDLEEPVDITESIIKEKKNGKKKMHGEPGVQS